MNRPRKLAIPRRFVRELTPAQYRALGAVVAECRCDTGEVGMSARQLAAALDMAPGSYSRCAKHLRELVGRGALVVVVAGQRGADGPRAGTVYRLGWLSPRPVDNPPRTPRGSVRESVPRGHAKVSLADTFVTPYGVTSARRGKSTVDNGRAPELAGRVDESGCFHPAWCGCPECVP